MKNLVALTIPLSLLAFAACSSDDGGSATNGTATSSAATTGTGAGGGSGGATASSSSSGVSSSSGAGGQPTCEGPGAKSQENIIHITSVQAKVLDLGGGPVANSPIQVCGLNQCEYGTTNASGDVVVSTDVMLDNPAFKFGDALTYARFGIKLTQASTVFPSVTTGKFPTSGAALDPGTDATSGDVTLGIAADAVVVIDTLTYDEPDKQLFRAVTIPIDQATPEAVPPALGFVQLYGAAPEDTSFCPAVTVTVPNTAALRADSDVEFWVHGVNALEEWVPYVSWTKASDGKVSSDGATISTVAGQGMSMLSSFAIKPK